MSGHNTFTRWMLAVLPRAFSGPMSTRMFGALGLMTDLLADAARQAVRARWVLDDTPPEFLPYIGAAREMPRWPTESEASYRDVLRRPWDYHAIGGSVRAVVEALERTSIAATTTFSIDEEPSDDPTDFKFAVVLDDVPEVDCLPTWTYGSGYQYGTAGEAGRVYFCRLPAPVAREIRDVAKTRGPKRSKLIAILGGIA